jgi:hypothetical protein
MTVPRSVEGFEISDLSVLPHVSLIHKPHVLFSGCTAMRLVWASVRQWAPNDPSIGREDVDPLGPSLVSDALPEQSASAAIGQAMGYD